MIKRKAPALLGPFLYLLVLDGCQGQPAHPLLAIGRDRAIEELVVVHVDLEERRPAPRCPLRSAPPTEDLRCSAAAHGAEDVLHMERSDAVFSMIPALRIVVATEIVIALCTRFAFNCCTSSSRICIRS